MGTKNFKFDFTKNDLALGDGSLVFVEGAAEVLQEITLELITLRGSMPYDATYGSWLKGALGKSNLSEQDIRSEVERIASAHPKVEKFHVWFEDGRTFLRVNLFEEFGGTSESANLF